jgi:hypothetical protein
VITKPEPSTLTYYRVKMACAGCSFFLPFAEGERLLEELAARSTKDAIDQKAFFKFEDIFGVETSIQFMYIEGVWYTSPETRALEREWNSAVDKEKDWNE